MSAVFAKKKYHVLADGLLCTGRKPHWFCSDCLSRSLRQKLESAQPNLRCIDESCEAMYINTHLLEKVMAFTNDPSFYVQYTQVSLMEYKRDHPYRLMQENGWTVAQVMEAAGTMLDEIGFA